MATTWPLPERFLKKHLAAAQKILFVEEVAPTLEDHVKALAAEWGDEIGHKTFFGKKSGHPLGGELNPDLVLSALSRIFGIPYEAVPEDFSREVKNLSEGFAPREA